MTSSSAAASHAFPNAATASLAELRQEIGRYFGYHAGTATAGSTGSLTTVDNGDADDLWIGCYLRIAQAGGAAPEGEWARVLDFASGVYTVRAGAFSAAVEAGDAFEVYSRVTPDEIDNAINRTADGQPAIAQIETTAGVSIYQMSIDGLTDSRQIQAIWCQRASDNRAVRVREWQAITGPQPGFTIQLAYSPLETDTLWVEYTMGPGGMMNDRSLTTLPVKLARAAAIVRLLEDLLSRQDEAGMQRLGTLLRDMRVQLAQETAAYSKPVRKARTQNWTRSRGAPGYDALMDRLAEV